VTGASKPWLYEWASRVGSSSLDRLARANGSSTGRSETQSTLPRRCVSPARPDASPFRLRRLPFCQEAKFGLPLGSALGRSLLCSVLGRGRQNSGWLSACLALETGRGSCHGR
jgi:hypothetical protein